MNEIILGAGLALLGLMGLADVKVRSLPLILVAPYVAVAMASLWYHVTSPTELYPAFLVSVIIGTGLSAVIVGIALITKMVGMGDALIVFLTTLILPYVPYGGLAGLPLVVPLSVILAVLAIYVKMRKDTVTVAELPKKYRRVRRRTVRELLNTPVIKEYPVYVKGVGEIADKIFGGGELEANVKKVLKKLPEDAEVYTLPNYPFVAFFFASVMVSLAVLVVLSVFFI